MNVWRWFGISLFVLTAVGLVSMTDFSNLASGQGKGSTKETKSTAEAKTSTPETKKTEEPKKTAEPPPPVVGGDTLQFNAFKPKTKFYQKQTTVTTQKMTVMSQEIKQDQKQTFIIEWSAGELDDKQNYIVTQKIVGVEMEINIGGNKITYDSRVSNPKNPMTDFFEQLMKKSELKYTIGQDLTVKSVDGSDELIKALSEINPQMQSLLKEILKKDSLIKMAEPTFFAFPAGGKVSKDLKWEKESKLNLGPIGSYTTKFHFKYDGEKDKKDTIVAEKIDLTYTPPSGDSSLPFTIKKWESKGAEPGSAKYSFDRAKGRFEKAEVNLKFKGELTIEVSNMQTPVVLDQSQTATSTTYDTLEAINDTPPWTKKG